MFFYLPVMCLAVCLASPKPSKKFKVLSTAAFVVLSWTAAYCVMTNYDEFYRRIIFVILYSFSFFMVAKVLIKSPIPEEQVTFDCPFCKELVSFDKFNLDKSKHCPKCKEVITVTTDQEVHKETVAAREEILKAMDSEDLQEDPDNLIEPSIAPSVLGFQFELKKGQASDETAEEGDTKES